MSQARQVLVFAGFALATACGGGDGSGPPPKTIAAFSAPQTDTVLATLPNPLVALVRESGDPLSGVTVTWTAAGNGKVNGGATATTTTGVDGKASVTYQLGSTAGQQTPTAAATGFSGSPVSFALTATAGAAVDINKSAAVDTASTVRTMVTYTVVSVDSHGNPKGGVVIDWLPTDSIAPARNTTGTDGKASATRTLRGSEGVDSATATAGGLTGAPSETFTTAVVTLPATANVRVDNNVFTPGNVKIAMSVATDQGVTWTWAGVVGGLGHNVTFSGGTGVPLNCGTTSTAGATCQRSFPTAGTFDYSCTNHLGMNGTIAVR
jgi:plastocyanin